MSEATLRAALERALPLLDRLNPTNTAVVLNVSEQVDAMVLAGDIRKALSAHPARASQEPYPPLPTEWRVVSDVEGQPVKVYRAFQLRDYVDADRAARPESVDTRPQTDEELRLVVAHLKTGMRNAVTLARNSIRTNSKDVEDWREDMQVLADNLDRQV